VRTACWSHRADQYNEWPYRFAAKVVKQTVDATADEITSELQEALKPEQS
jgi:hypothetical protein